jgi:NADH-ubiquinone oxidoreductase chain 2
MIFLTILVLLLAIAIPSINKQINSVSILRITFITFLYTVVLSLNTINILAIGSGIGLYNGLFTITIINQVFDIFLFIIAALILLSMALKSVYLRFIKKNNTMYYTLSNYLIKDINLSYTLDEKYFTNNNLKLNLLSKQELDSEIIKQDNDLISKGTKLKIINRSNYYTEYCLIILFSILGQSLLISSSDLVSMYLSIELQSFAVYILATLYRDSEAAVSAGLKYFLLGAISSCFILLGSGLIYSYIGITNFESIYLLTSVISNINSTEFILIFSITLGFILIVIGLFFKVGAAPLHNGLVDVYDLSPNNVTV